MRRSGPNRAEVLPWGQSVIPLAEPRSAPRLGGGRGGEGSGISFRCGRYGRCLFWVEREKRTFDGNRVRVVFFCFALKRPVLCSKLPFPDFLPSVLSRGLQRPAVAAAGCIPTAMGRVGCKYLQEHGYGCGHGCELVTDFSKINSEPKITLNLVKEKYGPSGFQNSKIF